MEEINLDLEKKRYLEEFIQDLDDIEALVLKLADGLTRAENLLKIKRIVHSLKGTAGSYGFDLLSVACHKVEDQLSSSEFTAIDDLVDDLLGYMDTMTMLCESYQKKDERSLDKMREKLGVFRAKESSPELILIPPKEPLETVLTETQKHRVLIAEGSKLLTRTLMSSLCEYEVEISNSHDGYDALGRLLREKFDVMIGSLYLPTIDTTNLFKILEIAPNPNAAITTIVITSSKDKTTKIQRPNTFILEKGADLTVSLKEILTANLPRKKQVSGNHSAGKWKLMVIDDSSDIHHLVKISLKKMPEAQLIHCYEAAKAQAMVQTEKPDLILLDVQMPEIQGDELLMRLQKSNLLQNTRIAFLTATSNQAELNKLAALKPNAILRKPFSPKTILQNLNEILKKKVA